MWAKHWSQTFAPLTTPFSRYFITITPTLHRWWENLAFSGRLPSFSGPRRELIEECFKRNVYDLRLFYSVPELSRTRTVDDPHPPTDTLTHQPTPSLTHQLTPSPNDPLTDTLTNQHPHSPLTPSPPTRAQVRTTKSTTKNNKKHNKEQHVLGLEVAVGDVELMQRLGVGVGVR